MAAKLSDLVDEMSRANLQMEDHTDVLTQSVKDLWELEALDSPPSYSYSWELVRGWENQPTLPQIQWQFKRVKGPLLKLYQIVKLRQGDLDVPMWICQPNDPSSSIP